MSMRKIGTKLVLILIPLISLVLIVGNLVTQSFVRDDLQNLVLSSVESLAAAHAQILSSEIKSFVGHAKALASTPMLKPVLRLEFEMAAKTLPNILTGEKAKMPQEVKKCFLIKPDGRFVTN